MEFFCKYLTDNDLVEVVNGYGSYFKITADIELNYVVVGPKLHVDAVPLLKEKGSFEKDIWGGWCDLDNKMVETSAVWNIRGENSSMEILDSKIRKKFIDLVKDFFRNGFK
ncbi:hypothetical protein KKE45_00180 [Patescibacteria group bacterium]|nr:hypothetical protein [Patescibacteria group bacterium]